MTQPRLGPWTTESAVDRRPRPKGGSVLRKQGSIASDEPRILEGMRTIALTAAVLLLVSTPAKAGTWSLQSQPLATAGASVQPDVAIDGDTALWLWSSLHRTGTSWTMKGLQPPSLKGIGEACALSGSRAALGAAQESTTAGAVATLLWDGAAWQLEDTLTPSPVIAGARFGEAVGLSGDTLVVGAPNVTAGTFAQAGAVYVFVREANAWAQQAVLQSPTPQASQRWGTYLDVEGDRIVVGAASVTAHVFKREGTSWALEATLTPPSSKSIPGFGGPVELSGDRIAVGTKGDAWIVTFTRSGPTWNVEAELDGPGVTAVASLALSGDSLAVGSYYSKGVETYARKANVWLHEQSLTAPVQGQLGTALDMDGDTLIAQQLQNSNSVNTSYIFVRAACGVGCACSTSGQCDDGECVAGVCCVGCATADAGGDGQAGSAGSAAGGAGGAGAAPGSGANAGGSGAPGTGGAIGFDAGADAGVGPGYGSSSSSGCGCRASGRGAPAGALALCAALALWCRRAALRPGTRAPR